MYNDGKSLCKLEKKEKINDNQQKQSLIITKEEASDITKGRYQVLKKYESFSSFATEIYTILANGFYRPSVLIDYDRYAFYHPLFDTRITLDHNIRKKEGSIDLDIEHGAMNPVDPELAVLEIKYTGKAMGFISEILKKYGLEQSAYSKYCSSREVLI